MKDVEITYHSQSCAVFLILLVCELATGKVELRTHVIEDGWKVANFDHVFAACVGSENKDVSFG